LGSHARPHGQQGPTARHPEEIPFFDGSWYRAQNADLPDTVDPAVHFLEYGAREGRRAGPLFNTQYYLTHNPDVVPSVVNPVVHFQLTGAREGRTGWSSVDLTAWQAPSIRDPEGALARVWRQPDEPGFLDSGRPVALYVSSVGNFFFKEMANLIAPGLRETGLAVSIRTDVDAEPSPGETTVVLAPHEFCLWGGEDRHDFREAAFVSPTLRLSPLPRSTPHAAAPGRNQGAFLGPEFTQDEIERRLTAVGARFEGLGEPELLDATTVALVEGKAIGLFHGRMEFGPRALGARSILADPRSPTMQSLLNLKVKYRESFRPFAPCVLREDVADWFELNTDSPYMLLVADVKACHQRSMTPEQQSLFGIEKLNVPRSTIPAVTHVDYSARLQTVHAETNRRLHALLTSFKAKTGCPVLVNTSFNVRGEPIVCTPEDAFRCFMGTEIEVLVAGNCYLRKEAQDPGLKRDYKGMFTPD
jgi:Carbamoyltransferase C-terminus